MEEREVKPTQPIKLETDSEKHYCRLCAEESASSDLILLKQHLQRNNQPDILAKLARMSPVFNDMFFTDDGLPKTSCAACLEGLDDIVIFFDVMTEAQKVLRRIFSKKVNSTNPEKGQVKIESEGDGSSKTSTEDDSEVQDETDMQDDMFVEVQSKPLDTKTLVTTAFKTVFELPSSNNASSSDVKKVLLLDKRQRLKTKSKSNSAVHSYFSSLLSNSDQSIESTNKLYSNCFPESENVISKVDELESKTRNDMGQTGLYFEHVDLSTQMETSKPDWTEYKWLCLHCNQEFPYIEALQAHSMQDHNQCSAYKCLDCSKQKLELDNFIAHVRMHRKYSSCYLCGFEYTKDKGPQKHGLTHKSAHMCQGCNKAFANEGDVSKHVSKFFNVKKQKNAKFPCTKCKKQFYTKFAMEEHVVVYHKIKEQQHAICEQCGKICKNEHALKLHGLVHTDERPYECKICKNGFKTLSQLRTHVHRHRNIKTFKCDKCEKSFHSQHNLKQHSICHSDTLPYECKHCDKKFRYKNHLITHSYQHTGKRPYGCPRCDKSFTNWANLNKHTLRIHKLDTRKKKRTSIGLVNIDEDLNIETKHIEEYAKSVLTPQMFEGKRSAVIQETSKEALKLE